MTRAHENIFEFIEGQWERNLNDARLIIESESPPETLKPVFTLMKYNELSHDYEDSVAPNVKHRKNRLQEVEEAYRRKSEIVPTMGVELELPRGVISPSQREVINGCGIRCEDENLGVCEIAPFYSYSALTQSRILEEVYHLGVNNENIKEGGKIDSSLHVNYGVPKSLFSGIDNSRLNQEIKIFVDAVTYGFVSANRILNRKTNSSSDIKPAWKGKHPLRLELRTPDFASRTTFRMLEETQVLVASLFAFLKDIKEESLSEEELRLSLVWTEFRLEVESLLAEFNLFNEDDRRLYDSNSGYVSRFLSSNPQISGSFRELITKTSKKIKEIVQLDI